MFKSVNDGLTVIDTFDLKGPSYLLGRSSTTNFSFLDHDAPENPFGRQVFAEVLQVMKISDGQEMKVTSTGHRNVHVTPVGDMRMPGEIHADEKAYNVVSFMRVPFTFRHDAIAPGNYFFLDKTVSTKGINILGDSSIVVIPQGLDFGCGSCGQTRTYGIIPPSQIWPNVYDWVAERREVNSYEGFRVVPIGRYETSSIQAVGTADSLVRRLEAKFDEILRPEGFG